MNFLIFLEKYIENQRTNNIITGIFIIYNIDINTFDIFIRVSIVIQIIFKNGNIKYNNQYKIFIFIFNYINQEILNKKKIL